MEHPTDMCPTLQETKLDHPESVGSIGGYQYEKQPYANRPFEGQQFELPPHRPSPNQGPPESREHLPKEHLSPIKAESIQAQADFSGENHSDKNAEMIMLKLRNL
ncbi:hypothetical protein CR513_30931, partial [Mucuna pruriens]